MTKRKLFSTTTPYVVRGGGGVIAESSSAVILAEEGQSDRVFFPKSDVAMVLFDPSETSARDASLGPAKFYNLAGKSVAVIDAAWSYDDAGGDFETLCEFITFDDTKVTVEAL